MKVRFTEAAMAASLLAIGPAIALVLVQVPRPVPLQRPPALWIAPRDAEDVARADEALARRAPESEAVLALSRLIGEAGRAEAAGREAQETAQRRHESIVLAVRDLVAEHGEDGLGALRAEHACRLDDALAGRMPRADLPGFLGGFPRTLARYGATEHRRLVAPKIVARALFKARWNAICARPLTEGLRRAELRAYWGWLALHAAVADTESRLTALEEYRRAGGTRVLEARGALYLEADHPELAAPLLARAYEATGSLRLRNHGLWAVRATEGPGEP